jgi:hypothetical protein
VVQTRDLWLVSVNELQTAKDDMRHGMCVTAWGLVTEGQMRKLLITLSATLALAGCGGNSDAPKTSGQSQLYSTQRDALDKAKGVNDTLGRADMVRRAQEENQIR